MRNSIEIKLYDIFRKDLHLPDEKAHELVQTIDEAVKGEHLETMEGVATKEFVKEEIRRLELKMEQTKGELTRAIYFTNLIQFLAVVGSIIAILTFMLRK